MEEGVRRRRKKDRGRRMEDPRQDLRTEFRAATESSRCGLPATLRLAQAGRIWPCISGGRRMEDPRQDLRIEFRAATESSPVGRIWSRISRDVMRVLRIVKPARRGTVHGCDRSAHRLAFRK